MNVPLANVALPAALTVPISPSDQTEGSPFTTAVTVRPRVVELVKLPNVPVIVTGRLLPVAAVLLALSVRVLVLLAGFGLNNAVTPFGNPRADRVTPLLKPFCGVTVMVLVPLPP